MGARNAIHGPDRGASICQLRLHLRRPGTSSAPTTTVAAPIPLAVYIRIILEELGHKQPPTPLQTDNAMADAVINGKIQPK